MSDSFPTGPYQVVLCDPPWPYEGDQTKWGAAAKFYPTMDASDIYDIRINDLLSDDGVLFLWATCPKLHLAMWAIQKWCLHFRGVAFVWVKARKDGMPIGAQGVRPSIVKPTTELVLAASKVATGRPLSLADESVRQVVLAPKREHSRKPDEVCGRIEALYPDASKIELFARPPHRAGWDVWGLEAEPCK